MQTKFIRVERAFLVNGKRVEPDSVIQVPSVFADEMVNARKAKVVDEPKPASPKLAEQKTESGKKGESNAS